MSQYSLYTDGCIAWQYTGDGKVIITVDGQQVYDHTGTPPPTGTIPANAMPVTVPGNSSAPYNLQGGQLYYFVLPIPQGSVQVTKAPGSVDYSIEQALSAPADSGNWAKAAAMPVEQQGGFGGGTKLVYPYHAIGNSESAGLGWTQTDTKNGVAVVHPGWVYSFKISGTGPVAVVMQIPQQ